MKSMKTAGWLAALLAAALMAPAFVQSDNVAAAAAPDLAEVEIVLPEPFFGGTPLDYFSINLEPEDYKDRPPFMAPAGTANVALKKTVTSSDKAPILGEAEMLTDGDKDYAKTSLVELAAGVQWVQVDLGAEHTIHAILVWHFHEGKRVYFDMVARVSNDPEFKKHIEVYNNDYDNSSGLGVGKDKEYIENNKGRLVDTRGEDYAGVKGRYVRLYSNGNAVNDMNHYVEIEVFGVPAK